MQHIKTRLLNLCLGTLSGIAAGALSGFLAKLSLNLALIILNLITSAQLGGASGPLTLQQVLLNILLNAILLGAPAGVMPGAVGGAVIGIFTRIAPPRARVGRWLGGGILAVSSLRLFNDLAWPFLLVFVIGGGIIGALGGSVGDKLFALLHNKLFPVQKKDMVNE